MTDDQRRVRTDSDALLDAVRSLREAEQRKRRAPFSSKEFHDLAEEVEQQAVDVWKLAAREREDGEKVQHSEEVPDSVEPLVAPDADEAPAETARTDVLPTPLGEE